MQSAAAFSKLCAFAALGLGLPLESLSLRDRLVAFVEVVGVIERFGAIGLVLS